MIGLLDPMGWTMPGTKPPKIDITVVTRALESRVPEVKIGGNGLADVIDLFLDVTGVDLIVNWPALEAAGVAKDAPVNARFDQVKFSDALDNILTNVGGGNLELGYVIDESGAIVISTRKDLVSIYGPPALLLKRAPATRPRAR